MSSPEVVMLLWHGRGPWEADVFAVLLSKLGPGTVARTPQWDSGAVDGGRAALLSSLEKARELAERHRCPLVLAGWSLGATAALDVGLTPGYGPRVDGVLGLAVDPHARSPISGRLLADASTRGPGPAVSLVHGRDDEVVPVAEVLDLHGRCRALRYEIDLDVVATNHAGVLGNEYSRAAKRCLPSSTPTATTGLEAAQVAARRITRRARDGGGTP